MDELLEAWVREQGTMKSYRKELWFNTPTRVAFVNITSQVQDCLSESGVKEGLVLVNAMHITASVLINDDESGLHDVDVHAALADFHRQVSGDRFEGRFRAADQAVHRQRSV